LDGVNEGYRVNLVGYDPALRAARLQPVAPPSLTHKIKFYVRKEGGGGSLALRGPSRAG